DGALFQIDIPTPDLVLDVIATEHLFLVGHEELKQFELCWPHVDGCVLDGDAVAGRVQLQVEHPNDLVLLVAGAATQDRLDAGYQLTGRERLGDVIIHAHVQSLHFVVFAGFRRQHDNGQIGGELIALEASGQFDATASWQHPVQQHQVGAAVHDGNMCLMGRFGSNAGETCEVQCNANHIPNGRLVIHDQNCWITHSSSTTQWLVSTCNINKSIRASLYYSCVTAV